MSISCSALSYMYRFKRVNPVIVYTFMNQVEVFWVVTPSSVVVDYHHFICPLKWL